MTKGKSRWELFSSQRLKHLQPSLTSRPLHTTIMLMLFNKGVPRIIYLVSENIKFLFQPFVQLLSSPRKSFKFSTENNTNRF